MAALFDGYRYHHDTISYSRVARFPKPKYGRLLDPEKGAHGHERCSCCCSCSVTSPIWGSYCYQIFLSLKGSVVSQPIVIKTFHTLMKICCIKLP